MKVQELFDELLRWPMHRDQRIFMRYSERLCDHDHDVAISHVDEDPETGDLIIYPKL